MVLQMELLLGYLVSAPSSWIPIVFVWSQLALSPSYEICTDYIYFNQIRFIHAHAFDDLRRLGNIAWYPPMALIRSSTILLSLPSNNLHCDCSEVLEEEKIFVHSLHTTFVLKQDEHCTAARSLPQMWKSRTEDITISINVCPRGYRHHASVSHKYRC